MKSSKMDFKNEEVKIYNYCEWLDVMNEFEEQR